MTDKKSAYSRFLDGDKSGMEEIVREYNSPLIFFINGYVKNLAVAEDIAADTFCKVFIKKRRLADTTGFKTWLYTIARNLALDWLKSAHKKRTVGLNDADGYSQADFDDTILKNEQAKALHSAIKEIKSDYREVIHLIYFDELSYKEAAKIMKKDQQFIRQGMIQGILPIGSALKKERSSQYDYYISPFLFWQYTGYVYKGNEE